MDTLTRYHAGLNRHLAWLDAQDTIQFVKFDCLFAAPFVANDFSSPFAARVAQPSICVRYDLSVVYDDALPVQATRGQTELLRLRVD